MTPLVEPSNPSSSPLLSWYSEAGPRGRLFWFRTSRLLTVLPLIAAVVFFGAIACIGLGSATHALLHKRDPRSQFSWLLICVFLPVIGPLGYWALGVNRVETRARKWQALGLFRRGLLPSESPPSDAELREQYPEMEEAMRVLLQRSRRVTGRPLLRHNDVRVLRNGDQAYPAMVEAIDAATRYVYLMSYIFSGDEAGANVADALVRAGARGVDVRVLIDAVGSHVGSPRVHKLLLNKPGVRLEYFLPLSLGRRFFFLNLRNHRKVLIVDGLRGFTGGMNIAQGNVHESTTTRPIADLHFELGGPIVQTMEEVFSEDWSFRVGPVHWPKPPTPAPAGNALCRGIKDGPNEDLETLQWILIGALSCSRRSVRVVTPYFIPSRELISALRAAVLRGVEVQIVLPEASNLPVVDWACNAILPEVLDYGIKVYRQPSPFSHAKLVVVDDFYVNVGSANLDPRSLRLNFEFNVEIYDRLLAEELRDYHQGIVKRSETLTAADLRARSRALRLRDAAAKLLSPYL